MHPPTGTMATSKQSLPCAASNSCRLGREGRHPMLPQRILLASLLFWLALCTSFQAIGSRRSCPTGSSFSPAQRHSWFTVKISSIFPYQLWAATVLAGLMLKSHGLLLGYSYLLPNWGPKHLKEKPWQLFVLKLRTSASFMDMNVLALRF